MAQSDNQSNLKSLQKLSQADVRLLNQLSRTTAGACSYRRENTMYQLANFFRRLSPARLSAFISNTIDEMFFETVPKSEVYVSKD